MRYLAVTFRLLVFLCVAPLVFVALAIVILRPMGWRRKYLARCGRTFFRSWRAWIAGRM